MENKTFKLNDSELASLREVQKSFSDITVAFGQLHIAKVNLAEQEKQLDNALVEIKKKENEFLKILVDKYGQGTLNLQDGSFVPVEQKQEESVVDAGTLEVV